MPNFGNLSLLTPPDGNAKLNLVCSSNQLLISNLIKSRIFRDLNGVLEIERTICVRSILFGPLKVRFNRKSKNFTPSWIFIEVFICFCRIFSVIKSSFFFIYIIFWISLVSVRVHRSFWCWNKTICFWWTTMGQSNTFSFYCRFWLKVLKTEFLGVQNHIFLVEEFKKKFDNGISLVLQVKFRF